MSLFNKVKYKLVSYGTIALTKFVCLFKSYPLDKSMMIFGEPRSGTTWLMELLSNYKKCIVIWEPLNPRHGVVPVNLKNETRIFENPGNKSSLLEKFIIDVLTLKKINSWTMNYATLTSILSSSNTLTKFVRGTLLLPWITDIFSFAYKPVFIIRHPIAMTLSQMKGALDIKKEMMSSSVFKCIYPSRHEEYQAFINGLNSELARLVAMWCLYHKYILDFQNQKGTLIVIFYEDLLVNPKEELRKIISSWKLDLHIDSLDLRKPSQSDFSKQLKADPMAQLTKWQQEISLDEISDVQSILDYFEIGIYNSHSVLPVK
ncbi:MAG TPA: sulfotransferase [Chryseolinea sp.]|nr:sulfotransferase [Chryseolinea sp.]